MRASLGLVALLVVMAIVLVMAASRMKKSVATVPVAVSLVSERTEPRAWNETEAREMLDRLTGWLELSVPPAEELARDAATAGGWVAGTLSGSHQQHVAVKLRSAAGELAQATSDLGDRHRAAARRDLDEARATLAGAPPREVTPIRAIRDQLENLQDARREQAKEIEQ